MNLMFAVKMLRAQNKQTVDLVILFLSTRTELAFLSEKSSAILEKYYNSINHEKRDRPTGAGYVNNVIVIYSIQLNELFYEF